MLDLSNPNLAFILLSSENLHDMMSILWAKEYQIIPIKGFYRGQYEDSALAFSNCDNDGLRSDLLFLLNHFSQQSGIIKYSGEGGSKKVFADGSEKELGTVLYNTDAQNISYLYNGTSFSFVEQQRYWIPKEQSDFKSGMIVEYLQNKAWIQKEVGNPEAEFRDMYKLLIKYNKIRIPSES